MISSYLIALALCCTFSWAQDEFYPAQPSGHQQNYGPAPTYNFNDGGLYQSPLGDANRRSFQEQPQFVNKVFTLPDGRITTIQVPQGF